MIWILWISLMAMSVQTNTEKILVSSSSFASLESIDERLQRYVTISDLCRGTLSSPFTSLLPETLLKNESDTLAYYPISLGVQGWSEIRICWPATVRVC